MISEAFSDPLNPHGASGLTTPSFNSPRCPQGLRVYTVTCHQPQPKPVSTVYTAGSNPHRIKLVERTTLRQS